MPEAKDTHEGYNTAATLRADIDYGFAKLIPHMDVLREGGYTKAKFSQKKPKTEGNIKCYAK